MKKKRFPSTPEYFQCLQDWKTGFSIDRLNRKYKIPIGTLKTWHWTYDWPQERIDFQKKVDDNLVNKISDSVADAAQRYIASSQLIADMGFRALQSEQTTKDSAVRTNKILKWSNILKSGSSIIKNVNPRMDEDVINKLFSSIEDLKNGTD